MLFRSDNDDVTMVDMVLTLIFHILHFFKKVADTFIKIYNMCLFSSNPGNMNIKENLGG